MFEKFFLVIIASTLLTLSAKADEPMPWTFDTPELAKSMSDWPMSISDEARQKFTLHLSYMPDPWRSDLLTEFLQMDEAQQGEVVNAFHRPETPRDPAAAAFAKRLRLPDGMIATILAEAQQNGADPDPDWGDIPAFQEGLEQVRDSGDSDVQTIRALIDFAPISVRNVPSIRMFLHSIQLLEESKEKLAASEAELAASEADLAASEAELAASEADLAASEADLAASEADLAKNRAELARLQDDLAAMKRARQSAERLVDIISGIPLD